MLLPAAVENRFSEGVIHFLLVPESMGRLQSVMPHAVLLYIGVCVCGGERECVYLYLYLGLLFYVPCSVC